MHLHVLRATSITIERDGRIACNNVSIYLPFLVLLLMNIKYACVVDHIGICRARPRSSRCKTENSKLH